MVFETSHPDACFGFLGDHVAPRGYAYLLVHQGRATLATCLFDDFQQAPQYVERTLETILNTVALDVRQARLFSGYVNFGIMPPWSRGNRLYFVGERAGFQDALWGFGLRYALFSGVLAARAIVHAEDYDALCREHLVPRLETALANRLLFSQLGNHGYAWVLHRLASLDVIAKLREHHQPSRAKHLLFEIARRRIHPHLREQACRDQACACLWCTHGKQLDIGAMERCIERYLNDAS
jgi:flavin-dependent dehydrogenase